jgi:hypothetical protein
MAVHLVGCRVEERVLLVRGRCGDVRGPYDPDRYTLLPSRVDVARVTYSHLFVRRVQAPDVLVREAAL